MSYLRGWLNRLWHRHISGPLDRMYEHIDRSPDDND